MLSQSDPGLISVGGLQLPFRAYKFGGSEGPFYVFYCLWEDRAPGQGFSASSLGYKNRLIPVLEGRRNCGQRSLELAVWGIADEDEACAAMAKEVEGVLRR